MCVSLSESQCAIMIIDRKQYLLDGKWLQFNLY